jgi:hypothetical protein
MYDVMPRSSDAVLGIRMWGTCPDFDIERLRSWLSAYAPRSGPFNLLLVFNEELCGPRLTNLWKRLVQNVDMARDLPRIALVGTLGRPIWYGQVARRLTEAEVRCFRSEELEEAWDWVSQGKPAPTLLPLN